MNEYTIEINGMEHTVLLSDADAKERGLKANPGAKAVKPSTVEDKSSAKRAESK